MGDSSLPLSRTLDRLVPVACTLGLASITAQFGFNLPAIGIAACQGVDIALVVFFFLRISAAIVPSAGRTTLLRRRWIEFTVATGFALQWLLLALAPPLLRLADETAGQGLALALRASLTLVPLQVATFLGIEAVRSSRALARWRVHPATLAVSLFGMLVVAGTLALLLPRAHDGSLVWHNALFLSTSAVCVTGLSPVDITTVLTPTGRVILLILIQAGGLGILVLTTSLLVLFGGALGVRHRVVLQDMLQQDHLGEVPRLVRRILLATLLIEFAGFLALAAAWYPSASDPLDLAWRCAFHSVSAFCNAGFSILPTSLQGAATGGHQIALLGVHASLIVLGGLGYPVLTDLWDRFVGNRRRAAGLRLHTRVVLGVSTLLVALGTALFLVAEASGALGELGWGSRIGEALFLSITARTAGFNSLPMDALGPASITVLLAWMWIGAAPASTAGGIKVTTLAAMLLYLRALARGDDHVRARHRELPQSICLRAMAIALLTIATIAAATTALLSVTDLSFTAALFECVSAVSTVGLSLGATPSLGVVGELVIVGCMFVGRLGVLTVLLALFFRESSPRFQYPEERIIVG